MITAQFVLLVGDGLDTNAIIIGPFSDPEVATAYAEIECRNEEWRVFPLYPVRA